MTTTDSDRLARSRAELLQARLNGAAKREHPQPGFPRRTGDGPAPLSSAQRQLWYLHHLAPDSIAYNELITIRKDGAFDAGTFTWAFNEVIRRHEAWRTTFETIGGEPRQFVHPHQPVELPVLDLSDRTFAEAEHEAALIAAELTSAPYDVTVGPLLRPVLIKLSATHHRLYLALHHLIFDGVSLYRIVLPELVALYDGRRRGAMPELPDPPVQYSDYASWEQTWLQGAVFDRRLARCRERLRGVEPLDLPADHPRPARQRFRGSTVPIEIGPATAHRLRTTAAEHGATVFHMIAAVYAYWLRSYTERDDVVFATPHDLRHAPELHSMVGSCVTPVVIRVDVPQSSTCLDLLARVRAAVLEAIDCAVPFEPLVRAIEPSRDRRRNPLFQSVLVFQPPPLTPDADWSIHPMETAVSERLAQSKFDISVELDERSDGSICGRLIYDTDLFDPGTADLMQQHFTRLLSAVAGAPDRALSELAQPDDDELDLTTTHPSSPAVQGNMIHQLVSAAATRTPDAAAVIVGDDEITYSELLIRSQRIAERLRKAGAGPGAVVATRLDRSIDLVPALLGVLQAGGAYLPLDRGQPDGRSLFMVADARATVLLTDSGRVAPLGGCDLPVVDLAEEHPGGEDHTPESPNTESSPTDLAYVIYTSGSTGTPKGVEVEHRNVVNLMRGLPSALGLTDTDTVLTVASYAFDVSVGDIFATLARGATVLLATESQTRDPRALGELLDRREVTVMSATPTTWSMLVGAGWAGRPELLAVSGGESLTHRLADDLRHRCRAVWNGWGPTEATVFAGGGLIRADEPITVGTPLPGVRIYVLDKAGRVVAPGVPGEVVIAGLGVSRGYVNRPEESRQRFAADPFVDDQRMYRTGDRGRLLADGRLQHLGRYDTQVKVRGFRIELGEVEAALAEHPDVREAAVASHDDGTGSQQLVAYLVGAVDGIDDAALRRWASGRVPRYMVPTVIVHLARLPVTASGKLDRAALPAPPASTSPVSAQQPLATPAQRRLATLWSELLPDADRDPSADFFELGGHSILATQLLVEIERRLGVSISVADFLESGTTLAGLSALADRTASAPLAGFGSGRPRLFLVYPDLRSSMSMRHLSTAWEREHHLHPLITPPLGGRMSKARTVEDTAVLLLRTIRTAQPVGPYRLMGYSFGGLLTYEVARLLHADGDQVAWLGLLDTPTPEVLRTMMRKWKSPSVRMARLRHPQRSRLVAEYAKNLRWSAREKLIAAGLVERPPGEPFDIRHAWQIMLDCTADGHDLPLNLFVTTDTADQTGSDSLGWAELHEGPLTIHSAPGNHDSLISASMADAFTALVSASLRVAPTGRASTS